MQTTKSPADLDVAIADALSKGQHEGTKAECIKHLQGLVLSWLFVVSAAAFTLLLSSREEKKRTPGTTPSDMRWNGWWRNNLRWSLWCSLFSIKSCKRPSRARSIHGL